MRGIAEEEVLMGHRRESFSGHLETKAVLATRAEGGSISEGGGERDGARVGSYERLSGRRERFV